MGVLCLQGIGIGLQQGQGLVQHFHRFGGQAPQQRLVELFDLGEHRFVHRQPFRGEPQARLAFVAGQGFAVVYATGWEAAWRAVAAYAGLPDGII